MLHTGTLKRFSGLLDVSRLTSRLRSTLKREKETARPHAFAAQRGFIRIIAVILHLKLDGDHWKMSLTLQQPRVNNVNHGYLLQQCYAQYVRL